MRDLWKNIFYGLLIFLFFAGVFSLLNPQEKIQEISFSEFIKQVEEKEVKTIEVKGNQIIIELKDGVKKTTTKETGSNLEEVLISYGIKSDDLKEINIVYREVENDFWIWLLISVLPVIFIGVFLWWILRQGQRGATQAFSFSKARPRIYGVGGKIREKVSFDDVADLKEAKEELKEVVEFLREPKKFLEMGARIPRGVLLVGPPGCGKTLLA
ncbi:MAG: cell division protein FtsH, partial [Parcubacteria group bacterium CG07_land_8_20_14_0_80_35_11]